MSLVSPCRSRSALSLRVTLLSTALLSCAGSADAAVVAAKRNLHPIAKHGAGAVWHRTVDASAASNEVVHVNARRGVTGAGQHEAHSETILSRQELQNRNVRQLTDIVRVAPNLTIQPSFGSSALNFALRGVGLMDFTQNNTPSVMPYVDGVPYPVSIMTSGMLFDMDDISVAPGASGFTHGQSTTGGEINFHTGDPTPEFHAGLTEDIASYGRNRVEGFVSGPISKSVSLRLAGQSMTGGGSSTIRRAKATATPISERFAASCAGKSTQHRRWILAGTGRLTSPRRLRGIISITATVFL